MYNCTGSKALTLDLVSRIEPVGLLRTVDKRCIAPEHLRVRGSGDQGHRRGHVRRAHLRVASEDEPATLAKGDDLPSQGCLFEEALYKAAVDEPAVAR